jgi:hypothetical protein
VLFRDDREPKRAVRQVQADVGVCLRTVWRTMGPYWNHESNACRWHELCSGSKSRYAHVLVALDCYTTCPRCCVQSGQGERERPHDRPRQYPSHECVFNVGEFREINPYRYGLCKRHYEEIFVHTHSDDIEARANFLRRRALQCMVWTWGQIEYIDKPPDTFRLEDPDGHGYLWLLYKWNLELGSR